MRGSERRRIQGRRRIKTDAINLEAITELLLAGQGQPVRLRNPAIGELTAWATYRNRRVHICTATKNQLLGQPGRAFPGLTRALPDVRGTRIGRLVTAVREALPTTDAVIARRRRDGSISREGSVALRRAVVNLGIGLWLAEIAAKIYAAGLKTRGKHGTVVACALANRANRIAHASVRDHSDFDAAPWI